MVATCSLDKTAKIWDLRSINKCQHEINDHHDEVLDICYNSNGKLLATCSSDCTAKIWDVKNNFNLLSVMSGHTDEISKVSLAYIYSNLYINLIPSYEQITSNTHR